MSWGTVTETQRTANQDRTPYTNQGDNHIFGTPV